MQSCLTDRQKKYQSRDQFYLDCCCSFSIVVLSSFNAVLCWAGLYYGHF